MNKMEQFISVTFAKHLNPVQDKATWSIQEGGRGGGTTCWCAAPLLQLIRCTSWLVRYFEFELNRLGLLCSLRSGSKDRVQRYSGALAIINCKIITNVGQRDSDPDYAADKSTMIYAFRSPPPTPRLYLSDAPRRLGELHILPYLYSYSSLSYISISAFESTNAYDITPLHSLTVAHMCWGFYFIPSATFEQST